MAECCRCLRLTWIDPQLIASIAHNVTTPADLLRRGEANDVVLARINASLPSGADRGLRAYEPFSRLT